MTIISLKKVGYQTPAGNVLLHDIDLQIAKGELVVLSGPSGSGTRSFMKDKSQVLGQLGLLRFQLKTLQSMSRHSGWFFKILRRIFLPPMSHRSWPL